MSRENIISNIKQLIIINIKESLSRNLRSQAQIFSKRLSSIHNILIKIRKTQFIKVIVHTRLMVPLLRQIRVRNELIHKRTTIILRIIHIFSRETMLFKLIFLPFRIKFFEFFRYSLSKLNTMIRTIFFLFVLTYRPIRFRKFRIQNINRRSLQIHPRTRIKRNRIQTLNLVNSNIPRNNTSNRRRILRKLFQIVNNSQIFKLRFLKLYHLSLRFLINLNQTLLIFALKKIHISTLNTINKYTFRPRNLNRWFLCIKISKHRILQ